MSQQASGSSGRERLQKMKAAEQKAKKRNRALALIAGILVVVLAIVFGMWLVSSKQKEADDKKAAESAKSKNFIPTVTSLPQSVYDQVGAGDTQKDTLKATGKKPIERNGKPLVMYMGAEFCPFCAMERWSTVAALSRFGTFTKLKGAVSSPNEGEMSNINTMSFHGSSYKSDYITFKAYETSDRHGKEIEKIPAADQKLMQSLGAQGSIPWQTWGGVATVDGGSFNGQMLVGKSHAEIAEAMKDPNSDIAKAVIGAANVQSAQICKLTKNQPAKVCNSAGVKAAAKQLPKQ